MEKSLASKVLFEIPVKGGEHTLYISPWTMEQHDECFPIVVELVEIWSQHQSDGSPMSLGDLVTKYKSQVTRICQLTVDDQLKAKGLTWGKDLWGEDLFVIAQAIWQTSLIREGGEGVLGKAMALLGPAIQGLVKNSVPTPPPPSPESNPSPSLTN